MLPETWVAGSIDCEEIDILRSGDGPSDERCVATVRAGNAEANAALIAAAPEMLEALKQVTNAFARYISGSEGHYYEITQARAAIAKAEGK